MPKHAAGLSSPRTISEIASPATHKGALGSNDGQPVLENAGGGT